MGWKVVTIKQQGQDVIEGWVPEEAVQVEGGKLHPMVFETQACPPVSKEIRKFVEDNPTMDLDLYKIVDGEIVARTLEELKNSTWMTWEMNYKTQAQLDIEAKDAEVRKQTEELEAQMALEAGEE